MANEIQNVEQTPINLIQQAITSGASIEFLERLMNLQERWEANKAEKSFRKAMVDFQSKIPPLEKKKIVDFPTSKGRTTYKYAPLSEITEAIQPAMQEFGLSRRWEQSDENNKIVITCIISHIDGHSERTIMSANADDSGGKNDIQKRGSTVTYLQRYTLIQALGLATADEDNDGSTTQKEVNQEELLAEYKAKVDHYLTTFANADNLKKDVPKWKVEMKEKGADNRTIDALRAYAGNALKQYEAQ